MAFKDNIETEMIDCRLFTSSVLSTVSSYHFRCSLIQNDGHVCAEAQVSGSVSSRFWVWYVYNIYACSWIHDIQLFDMFDHRPRHKFPFFWKHTNVQSLEAKLVKMTMYFSGNELRSREKKDGESLGHGLKSRRCGVWFSSRYCTDIIW